MFTIRSHSSSGASSTGPSSITPALLIEGVEPAQLRDGALDRGPCLRLGGDVGVDDERPSAGLLDPLGQSPQPVLAARGERDRGALISERERGRLADPARGAGDERHGAVKAAHAPDQRKPVSLGAGGSGLTGRPGGGSFSL